MTVEPIDPREYGRLEQQVTQLTADVHSMKATIEEMNTFIQQSKGSWKTIVALASIAGSIGAGITWLATHLK
jgi:phage shock protein A